MYSNNKILYFVFNFFYAILRPMKKLFLLLIPILIMAQSPFETPKAYHLDLSKFNTKRTKENTKAMENEVVTCRYVCDKKIYKEQKIADAISFYKRDN